MMAFSVMLICKLDLALEYHISSFSVLCIIGLCFRPGAGDSRDKNFFP
jgi:hypothetical protein